MGRWLADWWYDLNYWGLLTTFSLLWNMRVSGRGHVPRKGPVLVLANHESFIDPPAVGVSLPRRAYFLARKTLFRNPVFGAYLRSVHSVPVDQDGIAKEGLKSILEMLKAGHAVVVFPEGERTWNGKMNAFKPGIHLLIRKYPVPVVPAAIAGAFEAMPRTGGLKLSPMFWPTTGADLAISIGHPIPGERFAEMPREQALQELFELVAEQRAHAEQMRRR